MKPLYDKFSLGETPQADDSRKDRPIELEQLDA
jgi:hypothetical protein